MARVGRPLPETPLTALGIFRAYLHNQLDGIMPRSKTVIDFLLMELLNNKINTELNRQRQIYQLSPVEAACLDTALANLKQDFQVGSPELEGWSLLHYRYVRVDLALEWPQIAVVTAQHERTLRRRVQRGLHRLAYALIAAELALGRNGKAAISA
jgi:hypothetical protein